MKRICRFTMFTALCLLATGCAGVLVPYHDEPLCRKGSTGGYCGSVTEVYDAVTGELERKTGTAGITKMEAR